MPLFENLLVLGMPPPYYPIASTAVAFMLVLAAAIPPTIAFYWKRRWHIPKSHLMIAGVVLLTFLIFAAPRLFHLAAFRGAVQLWLIHVAAVVAVSSLAVYSWLRRQHSKRG